MGLSGRSVSSNHFIGKIVIIIKLLEYISWYYQYAGIDFSRDYQQYNC